MRRTLTALFLLLSCASVAMADNDSGLYLGAGIGRFSLKSKEIGASAPTSVQFDAGDTSYKAFAGWRFSKYFGLEADYLYFGKPHQDIAGTRVEARIQGGAPYVVGTFPVGPLELFAKAGYLFYDSRVEVAGQRISSLSGSKNNFIGGLGLGMTLLDHLHARIEYEYVDIKEASRSEAVWLSGAWRF